MTRSTARCCILVIGLWTAFAALSCDRPATPPTDPTTRRIASLVPAATEILIEIGARKNLVAVSNYDTASGVSSLPRVGDYQNTDWETLAQFRPDAMIIQLAPDRVPPGLKQRADQMGIRLVNIRLNRLDDIYTTILELGEVSNRAAEAGNAVRLLRQNLDNIRQRCATRPSVKVLLVRDVDGREVIGPNNYLDDLLKILNTTNAAADLGNPYPSVDRETIIKMAPEAVFVLLPEARDQDLERSNRFWSQMTDVPAVADQRRRFEYFTQRHALLPGPHIRVLADAMASILDPATKARNRLSTQKTQP